MRDESAHLIDTRRTRGLKPAAAVLLLAAWAGCNPAVAQGPQKGTTSTDQGSLQIVASAACGATGDLVVNWLNDGVQDNTDVSYSGDVYIDGNLHPLTLEITMQPGLDPNIFSAQLVSATLDGVPIGLTDLANISLQNSHLYYVETWAANEDNALQEAETQACACDDPTVMVVNPLAPATQFHRNNRACVADRNAYVGSRNARNAFAVGALACAVGSALGAPLEEVAIGACIEMIAERQRMNAAWSTFMDCCRNNVMMIAGSRYYPWACLPWRNSLPNL